MALSDKERDWIECHFSKLNDRISDLRVDIATLKVKAGIWGLIGGVIPVLITLGVYVAVELIRRRMTG
jgi:hypothetical protein